MITSAPFCPNLNHRRSDAPVRSCPTCGGVVNDKIRSIHCTDLDHARRRKAGDMYCTGCSEQLRRP